MCSGLSGAESNAIPIAKCGVKKELPSRLGLGWCKIRAEILCSSRAARNRASMTTALNLEAFSCNSLKCKRLTRNHGNHMDQMLLSP